MRRKIIHPYLLELLKAQIRLKKKKFHLVQLNTEDWKDIVKETQNNSFGSAASIRTFSRVFSEGEDAKGYFDTPTLDVFCNWLQKGHLWNKFLERYPIPNELREEKFLKRYIDLFEDDQQKITKAINGVLDKFHNYEDFIANKTISHNGEIGNERINLLAKKMDRILRDEKFPKYLTHTPEKGEVFIGRTKDIQTIQRKFKNKNFLLIKGMAGIGKTTLAQEYLNQFENKFDHIAWLSCFSTIQEAVINSFSSGILKLNFTASDNLNCRFNKIMLSLKNMKGNNLLVIDRVNQIEEIYSNREILNFPKWKVLITTTANPLDFDSHMVYILSMRDATNLFYKYYKRNKDNHDVKQLINLIGRHTLTIELLAKNLQKLPGYSVKNLLEDLSKNGVLRFSEARGLYTPYNKRAKKIKITEILPTLFRISNLSKYEKYLLQQLSVLPSLFISYANLKGLLQIKKEEQGKFDETLENLAEKGWLVINKDTYKIHEIIQEIVRAKLSSDAVHFVKLIESLATNLSYDPSKNHLEKIPFLPYVHTINKYIKENNSELAKLFYSASVLYWQLGQYKTGLTFGEKALGMFQELKRKGKSYPSGLADTYGILASIKLGLGNPNEPLKLHLKAKEVYQEALNLNNVKTVTNLCMNYLFIAEAYTVERNFSIALKYCKKSEYLLNKIKDNKSIKIYFAKIFKVRSVIYQKRYEAEKNKQDLKSALKDCLKMITIYEEVYKDNPSHTEIASSYNDLSLIYRDIGDLKQAYFFQEKAVGIFKKTLKPDNLHLGISYSNFATIYFKMKNNKKAKEYVQKALPIFLKWLPENHPRLKKILSLSKQLK